MYINFPDTSLGEDKIVGGVEAVPHEFPWQVNGMLIATVGRDGAYQPPWLFDTEFFVLIE